MIDSKPVPFFTGEKPNKSEKNKNIFPHGKLLLLLYKKGHLN